MRKTEKIKLDEYLNDKKFDSPKMYSDWSLVFDALRSLSEKHNEDYFLKTKMRREKG